MHPVWRLINQAQRTPAERMLLHALVILSVSTFQTRSLEWIYDLLTGDELFNNCIDKTELVRRQLTQMENKLTTVNDAVSRLQGDQTKLVQMVTDLQTNLTGYSQAVSDAETRFANDIAALKDQIAKLGSGGNVDPATLSAIADSLDSSLTALGAVKDNMTSDATAQASVDPIPLTTLVISPSTVTTARNVPVQFSASIPGSTFSAGTGTVDPATGLYTPPTDPGVPSDSVTATSPDGKQTAVASVVISG